MKIKTHFLFPFVIALLLSISGCKNTDNTSPAAYSPETIEYVLSDENRDEPYTVVNDNIPTFTKDEITTESFEHYSDLDDLGRCGPASACIGIDLMPTEERGAIGQVKPSGWQTVKYDIVDGKYLYNRCHLIGYQLSGENANEKNLITGTRYLNVDGMLPFENQVADYVKETEYHVMYRVTPVFEGDNLVAAGVQMEAYSVEDAGEGVSFNVFVYNRQPGVAIDYATGNSNLGEPQPVAAGVGGRQKLTDYVLNTNTMRFHLPDCGSVERIKEEHRIDYKGTRNQLTEDGYEPCGVCKP